MLDALVAEARLRWGLDPGDGLQVAATENLIAAPIEPSRPLLIVPLVVKYSVGGGIGARAAIGIGAGLILAAAIWYSMTCGEPRCAYEL